LTIRNAAAWKFPALNPANTAECDEFLLDVVDNSLAGLFKST
jgi:hypothetical protein